MASRKTPKRPKKPKHSASVGAWERFDQRMKDWERKKNEISSGHKRKETLIKKYSHC